MAAKPTATRDRIGGVGRRVVDPDHTLTPEESALVKRAEREMRQGKFVTLARLRDALTA
jgi:hypothetical protein